MYKKRVSLLIAIAALAIVVLFLARESLTPLFLGIAFAYIFTPSIKRLEKSGVKRYSALICVYLIVIMLVFAIFWIGVPYLVSGTMSLQKTISDYFVNFPFVISKSLDNLLNQFGSAIFRYIANVASTLVFTFNVVINIVLGLVLSFYMILDREKINAAIIGLLPKCWRGFVSNMAKSIDTVLRKFLIGQLGVAIVLSAILFVGLVLLRIKYALLLAILAGMLDIVPYFGPFLGAVPAVIIAAIESPQKAIWTAILFIAVQQFEGAYVSPKILGDYMGLHPIITIMGIIVGGHLFGFVGMLLAVPSCGIIRIIAYEIIEALDEKD